MITTIHQLLTQSARTAQVRFSSALAAPAWTGLPGQLAVPACFPGTGSVTVSSVGPWGKQRDVCQRECSHASAAWLAEFVTARWWWSPRGRGEQDRRTWQRSPVLRMGHGCNQRWKAENCLCPGSSFPVSYQLVREGRLYVKDIC